jgi:hypothetical protein
MILVCGCRLCGIKPDINLIRNRGLFFCNGVILNPDMVPHDFLHQWPQSGKALIFGLRSIAIGQIPSLCNLNLPIFSEIICEIPIFYGFHARFCHQKNPPSLIKTMVFSIYRSHVIQSIFGKTPQTIGVFVSNIFQPQISVRCVF